jgi:Tol biopolymer transport system component
MKYLLPVFLTLFFIFSGCSLLNGDDNTNIPGKIVFAANDEEGNSQIFSMRADGTELRQLTFLEDDEAYMPAWSPDGTQIVFSTTLRSSSNGFSLYLMNADGSNMRPMNEPQSSHIPTPGNNARWSPDGSRIVFDRCVSCQVGTNVELFLYEFTIDSVIQITNTDFPVSNSFPTWSPDGAHIAYITDRDYVDADTMRFRQDLYLFNSNGSNLKRITTTGFARNPVWNPNGEAITFRSSDPKTNLGLFQVDLQSSQISRIKSNISGNIQLFPQAWSGDQNYLLATGRDLTAPQDFFMYIIDIINNENKQLPFGPSEINGADWFIPTNN